MSQKRRRRNQHEWHNPTKVKFIPAITGEENVFEFFKDVFPVKFIQDELPGIKSFFEAPEWFRSDLDPTFQVYPDPDPIFKSAQLIWQTLSVYNGQDLPRLSMEKNMYVVKDEFDDF